MDYKTPCYLNFENKDNKRSMYSIWMNGTCMFWNFNCICVHLVHTTFPSLMLMKSQSYKCYTVNIMNSLVSWFICTTSICCWNVGFMFNPYVILYSTLFHRSWWCSSCWLCYIFGWNWTLYPRWIKTVDRQRHKIYICIYIYYIYYMHILSIPYCILYTLLYTYTAHYLKRLETYSFSRKNTKAFYSLS